MITIKVLGSGCANCKRVEAVARQAVASLGIQAEVLKVSDYDEMAAYAILATPGLVINEALVSAGRIPREAEVLHWLSQAGAAVQPGQP
jgi:small redox-active disulfide protein 2